MLNTIKLEKEDIKTAVCGSGCNYGIIVNENYHIIFSKEAIEELISDYNGLKEERVIENNKITPETYSITDNTKYTAQI